MDLDGECCFMGEIDVEKLWICLTERISENAIECDNGGEK